jgi:hypothetical protein
MFYKEYFANIKNHGLVLNVSYNKKHDGQSEFILDAWFNIYRVFFILEFVWTWVHHYLYLLLHAYTNSHSLLAGNATQ